jgi:hypothetical protein
MAAVIHPSKAGGLNRSNLLLSQLGCVVEASHDVLAGERRELGQQIFYGVTVREHVDNLVDGYPSAFHARLAGQILGSMDIRLNGTLNLCHQFT